LVWGLLLKLRHPNLRRETRICPRVPTSGLLLICPWTRRNPKVVLSGVHAKMKGKKTPDH